MRFSSPLPLAFFFPGVFCERTKKLLKIHLLTRYVEELGAKEDFLNVSESSQKRGGRMLGHKQIVRDNKKVSAFLLTCDIADLSLSGVVGRLSSTQRRQRVELGARINYMCPSGYFSAAAAAQQAAGVFVS